jgi:hypothetical protein
MLRVIETRYKGYHFRSRTEARWACFFDSLSAPWEYELERYNLGGVAGRYLPDFLVNDIWVEVKGGEPSIEEINKTYRLSQQSEKLALITAGTPGTEKLILCSAGGIARIERVMQTWAKLLNADIPAISAAYHAARSARFEHGQQGAT